MTSLWFDRSQRSVVVGCPLCQARDVFTSQAAADRWAYDHAAAVHPALESRITASLAARNRRTTRR